MKKSLLSLAAALLCLGATAQTSKPVEKTFNCIADTWIRTDNGGAKNGTGEIIELRTPKIEGSEDLNKFFGLFGFEFERPEGMKVQSATLKFVTERVKAGPVSIHAYNHDFTEGDACWDVEKEYIEALLAAEPLTQFNAAGHYPFAIWEGKESEDRRNLAAWTNEVDVTAYVKRLVFDDTRANFLLHLPIDKAQEQVCFYTKDNKGLDKDKKPNTNIIATAEELTPALTVTFVEDTNTSVESIEPVADTFVRSTATGNKYGTAGNIEIHYDMNDDNTRKTQFYGIMSFKMPSDIVDGTYEVASAKLRLTHEMIKQDRNMVIYAYPAAITEGDACWNTEKDNVATALASEPIATYVANGQGGKAMGDGGLTADYQTVEGWTNYIDLTDYLKANPKDLNIMFSKRDATSEAIKIVSKDAKDIENTRDAANPFTFKAADMKPLLNITYTKKDDGTGVDEVIDNNENAPVEYYNLQGMRVENPAAGQLYIKRQGSKATKILFR